MRFASFGVVGLVAFLSLPDACGALASVETSSCSTSLLDGIPTHKVPQRHTSGDRNSNSSFDDNVKPSPYALAVTVAPSPSDTLATIPRPPYNFLATQVWPSARAAAAAVETHLLSPPSATSSSPATRWWGGSGDAEKIRSMCELGCGPGLPSLTAAAWAAAASDSPPPNCMLDRVVATDVEPVALELVRTAAVQQGLGSVLTTQEFDLVRDTRIQDSDDRAMNELPCADLYVLSDVFESAEVAKGAARLTLQLILQGETRDSPGPFVWVFAQSDRAQRDVYLENVKRGLDDDDDNSLAWTPLEMGPPLPASASRSRLWLCDVDETRVKY